MWGHSGIGKILTMGTSGRAILADDFARDIYDAFMRSFNGGGERQSITRQLIASSADSIGDSDDGPIFWLALAKAQWDTGVVDRDVLSRVEQIISLGEGLDRWREAGARELGKRQKVLSDFIVQLRSHNPNPRKPKPPKFQRAIFRPGDCLVLNLSDGTFGAAIVLAAKDGYDTYGQNLLGTLDFKSSTKPAREVFEGRRWLRLTHHAHRGRDWVTWCFRTGYRKFAHMFEVVGSTELRTNDPVDANSFCRWDLIPRQVELQFRWDAGERS